MKISSTVLLILLVGFIFAGWGLIIDDFEQNYINSSISNVTSVNSSYLGRFQNQTELNDSYAPILDDLKDIGESESWFDRLGSLAVAIPNVVVNLPIQIIRSLWLMIAGTVEALDMLGIPKELIFTITIAMLLFFVFKLVGFVGGKQV